MDKAKTLFTIGHSNHSIQNFTGLLSGNQIRLLIDVRRVPASGRYPHFNRKPFEASLETAGIAYQWLGQKLGGLREQDYAAYMKSSDFADGLRHLKSTAIEYRTAIMCAEADYTQCHRQFIAEQLSREGWTVRHITANGETVPHQAMLL